MRWRSRKEEDDDYHQRSVMQELEKKQARVQKRRSAQIAMAGGCGKSAFIGCPNLGTRDCIACFLLYVGFGY